MKFGRKLLESRCPEWADRYIRYKALVCILKKASEFDASLSNKCVEELELESRLYDLNDKPASTGNKQLNIIKSRIAVEDHDPQLCLGQDNQAFEPDVAIPFVSSPTLRQKFVEKLKLISNISSLRNILPSNYNRESEDSNAAAEGLFDLMLRDDIRTICKHYLDEIEFVESLLLTVLDENSNLTDGDEGHRRMLQTACIALWEHNDKLKNYLNLNILAVYKILKKKDKMLKTKDLVDLYPIYKSILCEIDNHNHLNERILKAYSQILPQGSDLDHDRLLKTVKEAIAINSKSPSPLLFFVHGMVFLGFIIASIVTCLPLSDNFNNVIQVLPSILPVFRFFFLTSLLYYVIGSAQYYLEKYGVNYIFLFNLSKTYSINVSDYFTMAGTLIFPIIVSFTVFLLDIKYLIFGPHHNHYLYPVVLFLFVFISLAFFNFGIKKRYIWAGIWSFLRTFRFLLIGFFDVRLTDSVLADVMTSLTKVFSDLAYIIYYFFGMITNPDHTVTGRKGLTYAVPVFTSLPFIIRFSQCMTRYIRTKEPIHLLNLLKYSLAINAIAVSSLPYKSLNMSHTTWIILTTISYSVVTIYTIIWDIQIDWGLSLRANIFARRLSQMTTNVQSSRVILKGDLESGLHSHNVSRNQSSIYMYDGMGSRINLGTGMTTNIGREEPSGQLQALPSGYVHNRGFNSPKEKRIMYPEFVYYFASIFNIFGRITWALTLFDVRFLSNEVFSYEFVWCFIQIVEMARRTLWVVLRLENEHLNNSSKYRAALWIPKMYRCKSLILHELGTRTNN